jgi:hypothetical protein
MEKPKVLQVNKAWFFVFFIDEAELNWKFFVFYLTHLNIELSDKLMAILAIFLPIPTFNFKFTTIIYSS